MSRGRRDRRIGATAVLLAAAPALLLAAPGAALAQQPDVAGSVDVELRGFPERSVAGEPEQALASVAARPELTWSWRRGDRRLTVEPFVRIDQGDEKRTHFDIRQALWIERGDDWALSAGIGQVFWGVTESQHLVDVINQTDLVENIDGEDKLGQPLVNLTLLRGWGALDLFVMPGFRARTFPGVEGRFRLPARIDTDAATYEADTGRGHVDLAVRWSHFIGDFDIGVSHFRGTGREPVLRPGTGAGGESVLVPHYLQINQTGIDVAAAKGDWLWKLEAINRFGQGSRFAAATAGFEYTMVGASGGAWDLGLLAEYNWDERGDAATTAFEDDLFLGARLTLNDAAGTDVLAGVFVDRESGSSLVNVEASRRFGDRYVLALQARIFAGVARRDSLFFFSRDDYVSLEISRYF